jgi:hypothetical protein
LGGARETIAQVQYWESHARIQKSTHGGIDFVSR